MVLTIIHDAVVFAQIAAPQTSSRWEPWAILGTFLLGVASTASLIVKSHNENKGKESVASARESAELAQTAFKGMSNLTDSLQEERVQALKRVAECEGECQKIRKLYVAALQQVSNHEQTLKKYEAKLNDYQLEVSKLKARVGELEHLLEKK